MWLESQGLAAAGKLAVFLRIPQCQLVTISRSELPQSALTDDKNNFAVLPRNLFVLT
jgi:hypothetical protein